MARIFGLTEAEMRDGIPWEQLALIIHPDDLARDATQRRRILENGGPFVWEHRIIPAPAVVRWVLARGLYVRRDDGDLYGHGIVIDVTDGRFGQQMDDPSRFLGAPVAAESILEQMADHALKIWEHIGDLDAAAASRTRPLLEALLYELGRQIAASLKAGSNEPLRHPQDPKMH
jgi:hypothetical protein